MSEDKIRYFAGVFLAAFLGNCTYDQCSPRSVEQTRQVQNQIEVVRRNVVTVNNKIEDDIEPKVSEIERKVGMLYNYTKRIESTVGEIKKQCIDPKYQDNSYE